MSEIEALEQAFGVPEPVPRRVPEQPGGPPEVTASYDRRLASLRKAEQGRYARCLDGGHGYASDSEASMAVVDAMVARHFTDGEIWETLEGSSLLATRVERKGERHARELYATEIEKARQLVAPLPRDPGEPRRAVRVVLDAVPGEPPAPDDPGPEPLSVPAGNDFVSRYVRHAASRTDAPLEAHQLMAVAALSAMAGPGPRLPLATAHNGWNLCIWGMYIVNSTVGRKTTVIGLAKDLVAEVLTGLAVIEWEGSPQGLIQRLQDRDGQGAAFVRDEYSGLLAQVNRAGGHLAGLPQLFIRIYDGLPIENIRTKKRVTKDGPKVEDTDRVERPYLAKLTASTWDSFMDRCTIDNVLDGFLARFVFITGAAEPRPMALLTAGMEAEWDSLVEHARAFHRKATALRTVGLSPEVLALAWDLEQRLLREAAESSHPEVAGPALKRLSETVLKAAALLAIDSAPEGGLASVTPQLFAAAEEMGERWKVCTLKVIEALGATSFMRQTEAVLKSVMAKPDGIHVRDLMRQHRRLRQREFEEILEILETREQIEVVEVVALRGRRPRVAYAFGHAPQEVVR